MRSLDRCSLLRYLRYIENFVVDPALVRKEGLLMIAVHACIHSAIVLSIDSSDGRGVFTAYRRHRCCPMHRSPIAFSARRRRELFENRCHFQRANFKFIGICPLYSPLI